MAVQEITDTAVGEVSTRDASAKLVAESAAATEGTTAFATIKDEHGPSNAPPLADRDPTMAAGTGVDDDADRESLPSRCSFTTTARQKTVPGDRGESTVPTHRGDRGDSMAPTNVGERGESTEPEAAGKAKARIRKVTSLTADALAKHTAALAKAQAEAYAATFASARSHYSKSLAGKSIAGKSIAGKSIAASGIVPSERTFRTHMTSRELLVGASAMRELMRSVSPISTPGVNVKRKRKRSVSTRDSGSHSAQRKKKKKEKKEKKRHKAGEDDAQKKLKALKKERPKVPRMPTSPSHYVPPSPTPFRGRTEPLTATYEYSKEQSAQPSHWQATTEPSATPMQYPSVSEQSDWMAPNQYTKHPKVALQARHKGMAEERRAASPCSSTSGLEKEPPLTKPKKKKRGKSREPRELQDHPEMETFERGRSPQAKKRLKDNKDGRKRKKSSSQKRRRKRSP